MRYGDVISRSFEIAWRRKYLWFLAVLAGEGGSGGGNVSRFTNLGNTGGPGGGGPDMNSAARAWADWLAAHVGLIVAVALLAVIVYLALFVLSCIAQGAVVRAAAEHDADRPYGLGPAWGAGVHSFWRILGLRLLSLLAALVVVAILGLLVVLGIAAGAANNGGAVAAVVVVGVLLVLILIPVAIVWGVVVILATRVVVLELMGPVAGIRRGFELLFRRFGRVALTWLISIGVGIAAGVVLTVALIIVALPFIAIGAAALASRSTALLVATVGVGVLFFIAVSLVVGGAVGAYFSTYWTLAYRRLDLDPVVPQPAVYAA